MIVRLKAERGAENWDFPIRFNSMIVRLKVKDSSVPYKSSISFNSMIVRLKAACRVGLLYAVWLFQFYDSPIKSNYPTIRPPHFEMFQFYDSPIKRTLISQHICETISFNSMIVRLKVRVRSARLRIRAGVSIL